VSAPLQIGDQVRHILTGKAGPILELRDLGERDGSLERKPRAIVLVACALAETNYIKVRVAYDLDDLMPATAELDPVEESIVRLKALPSRRQT